MTNELGTTLSDIEAKAERKRVVIEMLDEMANVASNYAPDAFYEWIQAAEESIRKYIEEN